MSLKVHFLNVGQGDCTIIEFPSGRVGMVDVHNLKVLDRDTRSELLQEYHESVEYLSAVAVGRRLPQDLDREFLTREEVRLTDPLAYYDTHIGKTRDIFRLLITHPDMDHMTGLHRLAEQDPNKKIQNFWHVGPHDFNLANCNDADWENCPYDKRDWEAYKKLRQSQETPKAIMNYKGSTGDFWTEDGVEIWAPTQELAKIAVEKDKPNIISLVLKITYQNRTIVLGGDATSEETWPAICSSGVLGKIDVLKAAHHGRKSGYHQPSAEKMSPWLTITSVGEKEHDATESYRRYSDYTVSLRKAGDVRIEIRDDGTLVYSQNIESCWKSKKSQSTTLSQFSIRL